MSDLTPEEQQNVRSALYFLRTRCGGWETVAKALKFEQRTVTNAACGHDPVRASLAFRVARLAGVPVDDLLAGRFPPEHACPHCGQIVHPGMLPEKMAGYSKGRNGTAKRRAT